MFDRSRADSFDRVGAPVEISLSSGQVLAGKLLLSPGRSLTDLLNGTAAFFEFEPYGQERIYIAKSAISRVDLVATRKPELPQVRSVDEFDPARILGVPSGASGEVARAAWHRLSKLYHPDRYAGVELPPEVQNYLQGMARRINAAYSAFASVHDRPR